MKRLVTVIGLLLIMGLALPMMVMAAENGNTPFPSTNDANREGGRPHVNLVKAGNGWVELEFVMPYNFAAVFEVRVDNAPPTEKPHWAAPHYDFLDDDETVYEPYYVVNGGNLIERFDADEIVEVRHAAGAESNWYFDWVQFPVPVSIFSYKLPIEIYEKEDIKVPVAFTNSGWAYESVRFAFRKAEGPGDVIFKATDSAGNEHEFTNDGFWGPEGGFSIPDEYSATTDWTLNFSALGDYVIEFMLVDVNTEEVITSQEEAVHVLSKDEPGDDEPGDEPKPDNEKKGELPRTSGGGFLFHLWQGILSIFK
ncbi:MAG: hypothetical protein WDA11_13325 [Thiohalomonadaceae bacterium]